jgi:hypothetical protein
MRPTLLAARALLAALALLWAAPAALAYDCPKPTQQLTRDQTTEVKSSVTALGGLSGSGFERKSADVAQELFSRYPHADNLALANTMLSMFCQVILPSPMSDAEKLDQLYRLEDRLTGYTGHSVPLDRAVAAACPTDSRDVLAPILALFQAWERLDVDQYLEQWGPDAIARSRYYVFKMADYAQQRRADFAQFRTVDVVSIAPRVVYADPAKAKVLNTYTMRFVRRDGRVVDERGVRETYVLECLADQHRWLIRENNDYQ